VTSYKDKLFYTSFILIWLIQLISGMALGYPPSAVQVSLGIDVNIVRIISWLILGFGINYFFNSLAVEWNKFGLRVAMLMVIISPSIKALWLIDPWISMYLGLLLAGLALYFKSRNNLGLIVIAATIFIFNFWQYGNNSSIFRVFNIEKTSTEVISHFLGEDSLSEKIDFPLFFRRLGYNKYFFVVKNLAKEGLGFINFESWFFQEFHPSDTKSFVILFWPAVMPFLIGLWFLADRKEKRKQNFILLLIGLALLNYFFNNGPIYLRQILAVLPLVLIIGEGLTVIKKWKWLMGLMIFLLFYGFQAGIYDWKNQMEYWFDNRPLAYDYIFKTIKTLDVSDRTVEVTGLIGDSKMYCRYYLGKICDSSTFIFDSFDLREGHQTNKYYIGFMGEFLGSDFNNNFPQNWRQKINDKGLKIVSEIKVKNTIAYRYGDYLLVAIDE
jgi:hypothetical protein